jgi:hypothetical protein
MYNNISRFTIIAIVISLVAVAVVTKVGAVPISGMTMQSGSQTSENTTKPGATIAIDPIQLKLALRDLWVDHIAYTRKYIISFAAGLPDTKIVAQRLLKNQEDIGNAIKPFYGNEAGDRMTSLLKGHILGAVEILKAAKAGNTTGAAAAEKKWYSNSDEIAAFPSTANPNWSKADLKTMLDNHLNLTLSEAVATLGGKYSDSIAAFDKIHQQAMVMSDSLTDGIVKQFSNKFSRTSNIMTS